MQTLDSPTQAYRRDDWQHGYQSQRQELSYWLDADDIEGQLPPDLQGTLFRNGPGLMDIGGIPIAHPFDGDGLICRFAFAGDRVHFCNRFVRTAGFLAEQEANRPLYRGVFGTQKPGGWWANLFDLNLKNIANTNIIYWGGKLLALWEGAEPHRLDPATLETFGIDRLDGLLGEGDAFAAHPRVDPGRGAGDRRLVNFAVKPGLSTSIVLYEFDESGRCLGQQTRTVPGFAFLHDFALTPKYAIFFQNPVSFNPLPFLLGFRGAGQCLRFDPKQPTRAIVIPRDPSAEMRVFETEPCFVFHHANAFERDGKLVVDSVCYDSFPSVDPSASFLEVDFDAIPAGQLWRYELDLATGGASVRTLESRCCEFPALHPRCGGREHRYLYIGAAHAPTGNAPLQALLKLDLETGDRQLHSLAPRGFAGEPVFVPRSGGTAADGAEDDGWVLMLTYNAARHASDLLVFDARDIAAGPIATLRLKVHVPYGLHGSFVPEVFAPQG